MTNEEKAALAAQKAKEIIERLGIARGSAADKLRRQGPGTGDSDFEPAPTAGNNLRR